MLTDEPLPPASVHQLPRPRPPSHYSEQRQSQSFLKENRPLLESRLNSSNLVSGKQTEAALKNISNLSASLRLARDREEEMKKEFEGLLVRCDDCERRLMEESARADQLAEEAEFWKERSQQLQRQANQRDEQCQQKIRQIQIASQKKNELFRASLLQKNEEIRRFMARVSEASEVKEERWQNEIRNLRLQSEANKTKMARVAQLKDQLQGERQDILSKMAQIKKDKKEKSKSLHELDKRCSVLEAENRALQSENESLRREILQQKENFNATRREKQGELEQQNELLQQLVNEERQIAKSLQKRLMENNGQLKEIEVMRAHSQAKCQSLQQQLRQKQNRLEETKEELTRTRAALEQARNSLRLESHRFESQRQMTLRTQQSEEVNSLRLKLENVEKQKSSVKLALEKQVYRLREQNSKLARLAEQDAARQKHKLELALKQSQLQSQMNKLQFERKQLKNQQDEVWRQKQRLRDQKQQLVQQRFRVRKLQEELELRAESVNQIESHYNVLKEESEEHYRRYQQRGREAEELKVERDRLVFVVQEKELEADTLRKKLQLRQRRQQR